MKQAVPTFVVVLIVIVILALIAWALIAPGCERRSIENEREEARAEGPQRPAEPTPDQVEAMKPEGMQ